jgi:hypothetical protein
MAYDEQLANRIRQAFGAQKDITERKMFGGLAFLYRGRMCCGIVGRDLMCESPTTNSMPSCADDTSGPWTSRASRSGDSPTSRRRASGQPPCSKRGCLAASGPPTRRRWDRRSVARARSVLPRVTAARFDKAPVEQRSGLARFGRDDLFRDAPKVRSRDVRLRTERIEDLPRSGNEGCGASRTERAHDIPRMRGHES